MDIIAREIFNTDMKYSILFQDKFWWQDCDNRGNYSSLVATGYHAEQLYD
jgi:hypothetical protein